jgi:mycobactin peptide synthetase MbtE
MPTSLSTRWRGACVRRAGRTPVFQTLFALQGNAEPRLELLRVRTEFLRQPYLDLPLELHAELWPQERGDVEMVVSFRLECVNEATAIELAKLYTERLSHRA